MSSDPVDESPYKEIMQHLSGQLAWRQPQHATLSFEAEDDVVLALLKTRYSACLIRHFGRASGYYLKHDAGVKPEHCIVASEAYYVGDDRIPLLRNVTVNNELIGSEALGEYSLRCMVKKLPNLDHDTYNVDFKEPIGQVISEYISIDQPKRWLADADPKRDKTEA